MIATPTPNFAFAFTIYLLHLHHDPSIELRFYHTPKKDFRGAIHLPPTSGTVPWIPAILPVGPAKAAPGPTSGSGQFPRLLEFRRKEEVVYPAARCTLACN